MEDLTQKLKVGDKIYMPIVITHINHEDNYPILADSIGSEKPFSFTKYGTYADIAKTPDLVLSASEYPKVMEVSNGEDVKNSPLRKWIKRVVIAKNDKGFIAYDAAETLEQTKYSTAGVLWKFAREVQSEPERVKLTIQDIADKLGVDAKLIDIIK